MEILNESADIAIESGPAVFGHVARNPKDIPSSRKIEHQWLSLTRLLPNVYTAELRMTGTGCTTHAEEKIKSRILNFALLKIVTTLSAYIHANNRVLVFVNRYF